MHRNVGVGELWKKWKESGWPGGFGRDFQIGKTFKYYFQCRRADILGARDELLPRVGRRSVAHPGLALIFVPGYPVLTLRLRPRPLILSRRWRQLKIWVKGSVNQGFS